MYIEVGLYDVLDTIIEDNTQHKAMEYLLPSCDKNQLFDMFFESEDDFLDFLEAILSNADKEKILKFKEIIDDYWSTSS
jgi:hypothetical protein